MHDWLAMGLFGLGTGLVVSGIIKRRNRMQPIAKGQIRPEFAVMGEIVRPLILFAVTVFALEITLFYFLLGGQHFLTLLDYAGTLFVLAAYAGWLIAATRPRVGAPAARVASNEEHPAHEVA